MPRLEVAALIATSCVVTLPAFAVVTESELAAYEAKREATIVENLRKLAPDAATDYESAVAAMNADEMMKAKRLLEELHHEVPGFTAVTRRLCLVNGTLDQRGPALALCREAAGDGTARSLAALAYGLTGFGDLTHVPEPAELSEAVAAAEKAVALDPEDVLAQRALCITARLAGDIGKMRSCTAKLSELDVKESASAMWLERARMLLARSAERAEPNAVELDESTYAAKQAAEMHAEWTEPAFVLAEVAVRRNETDTLEGLLDDLHQRAPEDVRTHYYSTISALASGDVERARRSLERATALGLDEANRAELQQQIDDLDPVPARWLYMLGAFVAVSAGGLAFYARKRRGAA